MSNVSHRDGAPPVAADYIADYTGSGSPEGVITAVVGSTYRNATGTTSTTFWVKESGSGNTGWTAYSNAAVVAALQAELDATQASQAVVNTNLNDAVVSLVAADSLLDGRLDAVEANNWVTTARIADDQVTNAELANMAAATIKGSIAGGDPADLTATEATALLNLATTSVKGLAPVLSNAATDFLNGTGAYSVPKRTVILWYGSAAVTAGTTDVFLNPVGQAVTPANTTARPYPCPVTGNIVGVHYHTNTAHTTNTVTVEARIAGTPTAVGPFSVAATVTDQYTAVSPGVAVTRGQTISCQVDHNGATGLVNVVVGFEIEF